MVIHSLSSKIRVLLVDDHGLLREALRTFLVREPDIEIVGSTGDGREALRLMREHSPDVAVLDVAMPSMNGIALAARLLARYPQVKVIALSMHADTRYVMGMLNAGAIGYVTKTGEGKDLLHAIRAAVKGQSYLCPEAAGAILRVVTQGARGDAPVSVALGRRESEVLQLAAEGHRSRAIAEQLAISPATVDTHRRNIMRKLGLNNIAELTKYAIREGLTLP